MSRACDQCSKRLITQRADARFCDDICKARWHNAERSKRGATAKRIPGADGPDVHALADARAAQEATKLKDHYSQVIYQGIIERLERGPVHADDLEDLFPESDRTMCRKLVGAQFGSLASRHYIREKERRKSSVPSRKGAKSGVFEFTQKGRERLAGVGAGRRTQSLSGAHSGESPARIDAGPPDEQSPARPACASLGASVDPGGDSSVHGRQRAHDAGEPRPTSEPLTLLPEPDPEAWAA